MTQVFFGFAALLIQLPWGCCTGWWAAVGCRGSCLSSEMGSHNSEVERGTRLLYSDYGKVRYSQLAVPKIVATDDARSGLVRDDAIAWET